MGGLQGGVLMNGATALMRKGVTRDLSLPCEDSGKMAVSMRAGGLSHAGTPISDSQAPECEKSVVFL